jgi:two-component system cell cycle sensor histidine kinase/response regulator CckA
LFAARALENKGYSVVQAGSAEVALDFLANSDQRIDIAITDVVMPNMDGPTLIKRAHPLRPDMEVIFISGYAEEAFSQNLDPNILFSFVSKPFNLRELAAKVKEVMSS